MDGQAKYFWAPDTIERTFSHKVLVETLGKSQMRSYPVGTRNRQVYPHLLWLGRCEEREYHWPVIRPLFQLDFRALCLLAGGD